MDDFVLKHFAVFWVMFVAVWLSVTLWTGRAGMEDGNDIDRRKQPFSYWLVVVVFVVVTGGVIFLDPW